MATGRPRLAALDENRSRERPPQWSGLDHPAAFVAQGQKWFQDHYGFRDFLIRLKTQWDFSLFGVSDKVYVGKDGWLFYRSVIDVEKPREAAMTDADLDAVTGQFAKLRDLLAARHVRLVVLTNQLKDKFYGRYLPERVRPQEEHQRFDDFRARLHVLPGILYVDSTEILTPLMARRPVFHKTDFHWNDPAAEAVAEVVINRIAATEGFRAPAWAYPLKIKSEKISGGEATFMPLFSPPSEQALFIDGSYPKAPWIPDPPPPFDEAVAGQGTGGRLPVIVWYGDSFSDGLVRAGLADHFRRFWHAKRGKVELGRVLAALPSDCRYFAFQFIEVALPGMKDLVASSGKNDVAAK
jgi:hypothetical protein